MLYRSYALDISRHAVSRHSHERRLTNGPNESHGMRTQQQNLAPLALSARARSSEVTKLGIHT